MRRLLFLVSTLTVLLPVLAMAHPHMSLESSLDIEYKGNECQGFWVTWSFDPYFSASIIQEKDADRNGRFSKAESDAVYNYAFINLRKYGYFTWIRVGAKRFNPEKVESFTASIQGDTLYYKFFVPLAGKALGTELHIAIFDTTFYCACNYSAKGAATVKQASPSSSVPTWDKSVNKAYPIYYNPQGSSSDFTIYTKWKPGLETAWPEEVHVHY